MTETPQLTFFAPCPRGLESVLCSELVELHVRKPEPLQGGVRFHGPFSLCYQVNLLSRIANRVLWAISQQPYRTEQDIYQHVLSLPWPSWFSVKNRIKVHVSAHHCPLKSLEFITLRIKDAICDHFRKTTGTRPNVDTRKPDIGIYAYLDDCTLTIYLDTTGVPLFKRGYRKAQGPAPLRENLAAGILHLTGWKPGEVLLDPMCGSGTFLLEAAQISSNIAPGLHRQFSFEKLLRFDQIIWSKLLRETQKVRRSIPSNTLFGSDHNPQALSAARTNIQSGGFPDDIILEHADILNVQPPHRHGLLVTNPPYGVRTRDDRKLTEWYPQLGDALKRHFFGWRTFFFTSDLQLPKHIRLAAARRTPLFNGPLECRLFEYPIVQGSHRCKSPRTALRT